MQLFSWIKIFGNKVPMIRPGGGQLNIRHEIEGNFFV